MNVKEKLLLNISIISEKMNEIVEIWGDLDENSQENNNLEDGYPFSISFDELSKEMLDWKEFLTEKE